MAKLVYMSLMSILQNSSTSPFYNQHRDLKWPTHKLDVQLHNKPPSYSISAYLSFLKAHFTMVTKVSMATNDLQKYHKNTTTGFAKKNKIVVFTFLQIFVVNIKVFILLSYLSYIFLSQDFNRKF